MPSPVPVAEQRHPLHDRLMKQNGLGAPTDEAEMRHIADAAGFFAPELEILAFPAWGCLPYDRSLPSLRATAERLRNETSARTSAVKMRIMG